MAFLLVRILAVRPDRQMVVLGQISGDNSAAKLRRICEALSRLEQMHRDAVPGVNGETNGGEMLANTIEDVQKMIEGEGSL